MSHKKALLILLGFIAAIVVFKSMQTIYWPGIQSNILLDTEPAIYKVARLPALSSAEINFDILADIDSAKVILENYKVNYTTTKIKKWAWQNKKKKTKRYWTVEKLNNYDVILAIANVANRKIEILRLADKGKRSTHPGFKVDFDRANGVNTEFTIEYPTGYVVLAIKRLVMAGKNNWQEVVYSPYSKELDIPAIRLAGLEYVFQMITLAQNDLRQKQIKSKAFPSKFVADIFPFNTTANLLFIEHIDPSRYTDSISMSNLVNEVLTVIGINKGDAYRYAVSRANARGLFQFIPPTYKSICRLYKEADLNSDFVAGMNDHLNAAKASILLFDSDLSYTDTKHRNFLINNPDVLGLYLASSYNGGASRTVRMIDKHGEEWQKKVLPETRQYLAKYKEVAKLF